MSNPTLAGGSFANLLGPCGGLLAHRIHVEVGARAPDGVEVERRALSGLTGMAADVLARYASLGVSDLSVVCGHDDASARRTLDALIGEIRPGLASTGPPPELARGGGGEGASGPGPAGPARGAP